MIPLLSPDKNSPLRWHKRMGRPRCIIEFMLQYGWLLIPYTAIIGTVVLILTLRGM